MKTFLIILFSASMMLAQTPLVFFDGNDMPDDADFSRWGFNDNNTLTIENSGYTPGTNAIHWVSSDWNWQGFEIWRGAATDLSSDWSENHVNFKLKAPAGINTLAVYLYDYNDNRVGRTLEEYDAVYDGEWHQIMIPLDSLFVDADTIDFDETQVYWIKIEAAYENQTIPEELFFDDIWVGTPELSKNVALFNGWTLANGVSFSAWGFDSNDLILAPGEGYTEGSPAIVWETSNWNWQGQQYDFNEQDLTYSWQTDSIKIKLKAPAGINNLWLGLYDVDGNGLGYELVAADLGFDGTWKSIEIPLNEMVLYWDSFDTSRVTQVKFENGTDGVTVPERLLIDDLWIGNPTIPDVDLVPPNPPESITASSETAFPSTNLLYWSDVEGEFGETYNVYASLNEITDLSAKEVFEVEAGIEEGTQAIAHSIFYPMMEGELSFYYAIECVDNYGNVSETFTVIAEPFSNTAKAKMVISATTPTGFAADGDLSEWSEITPLHFDGDNNLSEGTIDDANDLSVDCYLAMDDTYLYVAFDVIDDYYTWASDNTKDWWDDEAIEFFIGLYEFKSNHEFFQRGDEPDYRLLFLPDTLWMYSEDKGFATGSENYYFEGLGESDYVIEAKIAWTDIQEDGDILFQPVEGMMIPLEILVADSDVKDAGNEGRLQWGENAGINPYHGGPSMWSKNWIGVPDFAVSVRELGEVAMSYSLEQNYPNPFNPSTQIKYSITKTAPVKLDIYNALGQKVTSLVDEVQNAGVYEVNFSAAGLASGIYYYSIKTNNFHSTKKMMLLK